MKGSIHFFLGALLALSLSLSAMQPPAGSSSSTTPKGDASAWLARVNTSFVFKSQDDVSASITQSLRQDLQRANFNKQKVKLVNTESAVRDLLVDARIKGADDNCCLLCRQISTCLVFTAPIAAMFLIWIASLPSHT